jgi:hypothetical protein
MRNSQRSITALACLLISATAYAAPTALPVEAQSPDVVGVVLLDMTKLSVNELKATNTAILGDAAADIPEGLAEYEKNQKRFIAAGGQYVGFVMSMPAGGGPSQPVAIIKLSDPSKADAMKALVKEVAPPGAHSVVSDLKGGWLQVTDGRSVPLAGGGDAAAGKAFAAALGQAGDAPIALAFVPNEQVRALLAQRQGMMQPAMQELTGQLVAAKWISAAVHVGQTPGIKMTIQTADAAAATALQDSFNAAIQQATTAMAQFKAAMQNGAALPPQMMPVIGGMMLLDGMQATAKGSQVGMELGAAKLREVGEVLAPALTAARESAKGIQSLSNMRQIGIAMVAYSNDHNGAFPAKLDDLAEGKYLTADQLKMLLTNPMTGEYPGYAYEPPADPKTNPQTTVILREVKNGKPDPQGGKLFLDGPASRPPAPRPQTTPTK